MKALGVAAEQGSDVGRSDERAVYLKAGLSSINLPYPGAAPLDKASFPWI
jgi:hypothetical protein